MIKAPAPKKPRGRKPKAAAAINSVQNNTSELIFQFTLFQI